MQNALKQIWLLLQPSWLSGLIAGFASLAVVGGMVIVSNYQGSSLQQELFEAKAGQSTASVLGFRTITDNLASNSVVSNLPLFLFWAALGVIVYFFAVSLWEVFGKAEELREELDYVNAPKKHLVRTVILHLLVRLLCLGIWLAYLQLFLRVILPYVLAAAHVAAVNLVSASGIGYTLLALAMLFVALQAHVVFLRLVWLRLRVFGGTVV